MILNQVTPQEVVQQVLNAYIFSDEYEAKNNKVVEYLEKAFNSLRMLDLRLRTPGETKQDIESNFGDVLFELKVSYNNSTSPMKVEIHLIWSAIKTISEHYHINGQESIDEIVLSMRFIN